MKIVVSATAPRLDAEVDPRFGRCQYLLIVDSESLDFGALENLAVLAPGGAGIQAAQAVVDRGVGAVITGNCGPNAYQVLSAAGIDVLLGASGSVRQAIEAYRKGELRATPGPSVGPSSLSAWPAPVSPRFMHRAALSLSHRGGCSGRRPRCPGRRTPRRLASADCDGQTVKLHPV